jgi:hypothetical protein
MFFIPGFLIALVTFPGVIVHEIAHRFFADLSKVPVYKVCYFRVGNPSGYVVHGQVSNLWSAFLIAVGPFIINTLLCSIISFSAILPLFILKDTTNFSLWSMFLIWLGMSIGMHAFPSQQDLNNFHEQVKKAKGFSPLLVFSWIMGFCFGAARLLSFFWFDAIYAFGVCMIVPSVLCSI